MRYALLVLLLCVAHVAIAGPRQVLVLRSEGTADAASRMTIDAHVLRLAKNLDGKVEAGDITLTEGAALVGCNPSETACKDDLLATLGVDEVVATTVTATPTGMNVTVRRIVRGSAPRAAQTTIAAGKSPDAKLDADIGPLFGRVTAPPPPEPADTRPARVDSSAQPVKTASPAAPPAPPPAAPVKTVADASTVPATSDVSAAPSGTLAPPPEGRHGKRWQKIGMGVGAGLVALGVLMWASASDVQGQIDSAPEPRSPADFKALEDLERKGDDRAGAGNLFFITGAALGGVSAYFYFKAGRSASTQTAHIAPAAFPHGAGVTLTIGGAR
jgi:hypothetical protein